MNSLHIIGRLGKDPEMRTTQTGKSVCSFSVAVDSWKKDNDGNRITNWFNVTCFDKTAEVASSYLAKGRQVGVEGSIEFRTYTGSDGQTRNTHDVIASRIHLIGGQSTGQNTASERQQSSTPSAGVEADEYDPFTDE